MKVIDKFTEWENNLEGHKLPTWEELPTIALYMDQVVELLSQYLGFLVMEDNEDKIVTSSAINNYVRMKIMPAPLKKKYSRIHIAYLIMICRLKQSLNISYIQRIIPLTLSEEEVKSLYSNFVEKHKAASKYFIEEVQEVFKSETSSEGLKGEELINLIYSSAIISGYAKLLTEELVKLQEANEE